MDDFAVCTQARESNGHILVKLDGNLRRTDVAKSDRDKLGRKRSVRAQLDHKYCDKALPAPANQEFWVCWMLRVFGCFVLDLLLHQGPLVVKSICLFKQATKSSFFPKAYKVNTGKSRNGTSDSSSNE